ncbi:putative secreted protein [Propionispora sp. 2/2-37]|uniref:hypothetical protein n=1 Tax=Propionispora sp. 2/2-37 TaxID=1677858 RepID=UPI0006BB548A|nr:hypothetical protein [Propionispora sp. 2/2-37]CUH97737.1 putative secreted protein [Propionispora sp. 2/2-37]
MRGKIIILLVLLVLFILLPGHALAAGLNFNINFARTEDGIAYSELWYDGNLIWRIAFLSDGARPVTNQGVPDSIMVMPDMEDGMFKFKIVK